MLVKGRPAQHSFIMHFLSLIDRSHFDYFSFSQMDEVWANWKEIYVICRLGGPYGEKL